MLGKIIGAVAGAKAADHIRGINEPGGALLAGGYVLKRWNDKREAREQGQPSAAAA